MILLDPKGAINSDKKDRFGGLLPVYAVTGVFKSLSTAFLYMFFDILYFLLTMKQESAFHPL